MKRPAFILLLTLLSFIALGQETPPPKQFLQPVNAQFYLDSRDSSVWHFKGDPYGWEKLGRYKDVAAKLNIADTALLLRKTSAAAMYAKLTGGNYFSGLQYFTNGSTQGLINGSRFHGEAAFLDVGVNPEFKVVGGRPIKITSGVSGYLVARGDSLTDSQGRLFIKSSGGIVDLDGKRLQTSGEGRIAAVDPNNIYIRLEATPGYYSAMEPKEIRVWDRTTNPYAYFGGLQRDALLFGENNGNEGSQSILSARALGTTLVGAQNFYLPNKAPGNYTIATINDFPDSATLGNTYLKNTGGNIISGAQSYAALSSIDFPNAVAGTPSIAVRETGNAKHVTIQPDDITIRNSSVLGDNSAFAIGKNTLGLYKDYGQAVRFKLSAASPTADLEFTLPTKANGSYIIATTSDVNSATTDKLDKSGGALTGWITLPNANPTDPLHPVPKIYFDNALTGITWKNAVRAKSNGNVTLNGVQTIDGVSGLAGGRYLLNNQTNLTENGIWIMSAGAWTRATDADSGDEIWTSTVAVTNGTLNRNQQWTCLNTSSPTIGTDAINYGQISGAGTYAASGGVDLSGNLFTLNSAYVRGLFSATGQLSYNSSTGAFGISLANLSAGIGLTGTAYNGSAAQTLSINQAFTPIWTGLHTHQINNLGAVSASAALLQNTTGAASGSQQYSPALEFAGNGYGTTGAASQSVSFRMFTTPIQGNTANGNLTFEFSRAGGAWNQLATLSNTGRWNAESFALFQAGLGTTSRDGVILNNTSAATSGAPVQYSPRARWLGAGLNTSTSQSNSIEWSAEVRPTSGTSVGSNFVISSSNNGGSFIDRLTINESGDVYSARSVYATRGNFGATSNDGFVLSNGSGATSVVPVQYSNRLRFLGAAWNTSGTPASNAQEAIMELRPSSGSVTGSTLALAFQNNNGGFSDRLTIDNGGNSSFAGYIRSSGRIAATSTVKTANYTASAADEIVQCNSTAAGFNVTLPTGATQGTILTIDNIEGTANAVTVVGTVNGGTNYTLNALKSVTLYKTATGSNTWKIRFNN